MNILAGLLVFISFFNFSEPVRYEEGENAYYDKFPVYEGEVPEGEVAGESILGNIFGTSVNRLSPEYKVVYYALPLVRQDYYWGKYTNASAGGNEISRMKILKPGDRVALIGNGYITLRRDRGYISPGRGYYYGSGLCWAISTLGGMMDEANAKFKRKYGMDLFVYSPGWRRGHAHRYATYARSNRGYGYTIIKTSSGRGQVDYTFRVNPQVNRIARLQGLRIQIKVSGIPYDKQAYKGQSVVSALYANKKLF